MTDNRKRLQLEILQLEQQVKQHQIRIADAELRVSELADSDAAELLHDLLASPHARILAKAALLLTTQPAELERLTEQLAAAQQRLADFKDGDNPQ